MRRTPSGLYVPDAPRLTVGGVFTVTCRSRKTGKVLWRQRFHNAITTAGLTHLADVAFNGGTQVSPWYLGLINNSGFSALSAADTMSSHAGWTELTSYDEATRVEWDQNAPVSGVITTNTASTFTISATVAVYGAFLVSNSTKGGTTGTLFATGAFSSVQNLEDDQTLDVTYDCTFANG